MIYLLSLDTTKKEISYLLLHEIITHIDGVDDWWHYLPSLYFLHSTTLSLHEISNKIRQAYPELPFFISKLDYSEYNGFLNKDAWLWLGKYAPKVKITHLLPIVPPRLSTKITYKR